MITRPTLVTSHAYALHMNLLLCLLNVTLCIALYVALSLDALDASAQRITELESSHAQVMGSSEISLLVVEHDLSALYVERAIESSPLQQLFKRLDQVSGGMSKAEVMSAGSARSSAHHAPQALERSAPSLSLRVCRALSELICVTSTEQTHRYPERHRAKLLSLAFTFTERALKSYREVDLARAQASLDAALELLALGGRVISAPEEISALYLWRGVISVERKQVLQATIDFQRALLLDPSVRFKRGFDHAETVRVFSQALSHLRGLTRDELARTVTAPEWVELFDQRAALTRERTLTLVRIDRELFSVIHANHTSHTDRANRPAHARSSRRTRRTPLSDLLAYVWGAPQLDRVIAADVRSVIRGDLSKGLDAPVERDLKRSLQRDAQRELKSEAHDRSFQLLGGWSAHRYFNTSVTGVTHAGPSLKIGWRFSDQLGWQLGGAWSLDAVDDQRDLTRGVSAWRIYTGPHWRRSWRHIQLMVGVALEGARISESSITREVGCKFFDLSSAVPLEICDPLRDIKTLESTWRLNARLEVDVRLTLSDHIQAGIQLFSATSLYESSSYPLGLPVGVGLLLGYSSE